MKRNITKIILFLFAGIAVFTAVSINGNASEKSTGKRVLVLGFDGMDHKLLHKFKGQGYMFPNIDKLIAVSKNYVLKTSNPPQSPVAWSNFITGMNPGGHGLYDFIAREPEGYIPYLSASRIDPPDPYFINFGGIKIKSELSLGGCKIPLKSGGPKLLRQGTAFWEVLEKNGVSSTVFRVPSNYPPVPYGRSFSGMGTPDLLGGYGSFTFCTDVAPDNISDITGGNVRVVSSEEGGNITCEIEGPPGMCGEDPIMLKAEIWIDSENPTAYIEIGGDSFLLSEGEWSDWVRLEFQALPMFSNDAVNTFLNDTVNTVSSGIVRLYLKQAHPNFELYITPVNIDPSNPALPISHPAGYAKELYDKVGYFYTQGMPEDTKALDHHLFSDMEFYEQSAYLSKKNEEIFDYELSRFNEGFMFFYFSDTDLRGHMFWSAMDEDHPQYFTRDEAARSILADTYVEMDRILGKAMNALDENDVIIAMSDHGFSPLSRFFNLNSWLKDNGYLGLYNDFEQGEHEFFMNVDWTRTRVYGLGFNGLYINQVGREGQGTVPPGPAKKQLMEKLRKELTALVDPQTGENVISNIYFAEEIYSRENIDKAPDMVVGFTRGIRVSDESALGELPREWFSDNDRKWTGDHLMDPITVPGVIFANRRIIVDDPALTDLAVTILNEFGLEKLPGMIGRPIFENDR